MKEVICDYCGNKITDENNGSFFITVHCSDWHNTSTPDYIRGEYSSNGFVKMGNMCEDCARILLVEVERSIKKIGFPERYEEFDKEKLKQFIQSKRGE